eukprot:TRINITY_DN5645_c0_g1_i1.p1 TRINITY_DN5645_c0_g1~~TRINITY_DN5645_c0_g1_i1.p1  ORF type:complete len:955 (-),score=286.32 TRINITY_DN5645_c0_g1_i1:68-2653(-)
MGHALNKILKDVINRYHLMRGRKINFIPGWDCHGLPIEMKALGKKDKAFTLSPLEVRRIARQVAEQEIANQKADFQSWGIMGDWDNAYTTMSPSYEAIQLQVFQKMVDRGLIYRGLKPVYWSPSSRTALAEAELEYVDDHVSPAIYVPFKIEHLSPSASSISAIKDIEAVIWTTTPWTLPANLAIAVHPDIRYDVVRFNDRHLLIASDRIEALQNFVFEKPLESLGTVLGKDLAGTTYRHPFIDRISPIILGDHVTTTTGTGLVHTAPGHGLDDYHACRKSNITEILSPVDSQGKFQVEAGDWLFGKHIIKEGNQMIIDELTKQNKLLHHAPYRHKFPYDWRSKEPVIVRTTEQWFADLRGIKNKALSALDHVDMVPALSRNRLEATVGSREDWCISRQRTWGVPIPVFYEISTGEHLMTSDSVKHVAKIIQEKGSNAWWELPTEELLPPSHRNDGKQWEKGTDTLDVWFDSGVSWASVLGTKIPADVYLEGSDQHRGWFQSSLLTCVAAEDKAPYRQIISCGFVMDGMGRKMSKSLGNVMHPQTIVFGGKNKQAEPPFGVDVLRLWAASSDFTKDVTVSNEIIRHNSQWLFKWRNTLKFCISSNFDFQENDLIPAADLPCEIDKLILHKLWQISENATQSYDSYSFTKVVRYLIDFCTIEMSGNYLDVLKDRLYASHPLDPRRRSAQTTLHHITSTLTKLMAPITFMTAEEVHSHRGLDTSSVFQSGWVLDHPEWNQPHLEEKWQHINRVREMAFKDAALQPTYKAGNNLHFDVHIVASDPIYGILASLGKDLAELFVAAEVTLEKGEISTEFPVDVKVRPAKGLKCPRCWRHTSPSEGQLCNRCAGVIEASNAAQAGRV